MAFLHPGTLTRPYPDGQERYPHDSHTIRAPVSSIKRAISHTLTSQRPVFDSKELGLIATRLIEKRQQHILQTHGSIAGSAQLYHRDDLLRWTLGVYGQQESHIQPRDELATTLFTQSKRGYEEGVRLTKPRPPIYTLLSPVTPQYDSFSLTNTCGLPSTLSDGLSLPRIPRRSTNSNRSQYSPQHDVYFASTTPRPVTATSDKHTERISTTSRHSRPSLAYHNRLTTNLLEAGGLLYDHNAAKSEPNIAPPNHESKRRSAASKQAEYSTDDAHRYSDQAGAPPTEIRSSALTPSNWVSPNHDLSLDLPQHPAYSSASCIGFPTSVIVATLPPTYNYQSSPPHHIHRMAKKSESVTAMADNKFESGRPVYVPPDRFNRPPSARNSNPYKDVNWLSDRSPFTTSRSTAISLRQSFQIPDNSFTPSPPMSSDQILESRSVTTPPLTHDPEYQSRPRPHRAAKRPKLGTGASVHETEQGSFLQVGRLSTSLEDHGGKHPSVTGATLWPTSWGCSPGTNCSSDSSTSIAHPGTIVGKAIEREVPEVIVVEEHTPDEALSGVTTHESGANTSPISDVNKAMPFREVVCFNDSIKRRKRPALFSCSQPGCSASFTARHNLRNHTNSHMGLKLHKCRFCNKGFNTSHDLDRHQRDAETTGRKGCRGRRAQFKNTT
ncbi:hypothetical protein V5O48_018023 [Marasmius crinis-equi]|uniref:C2H2-type domain-containing protein n=1 Tax=Marasmius crinis-equi TaxID=585013 RepID=A0ABR3EMJ2_9AGAR